VRTTQQRHVQHAGQLDVFHELATAQKEAAVFLPPDGFSDHYFGRKSFV
jgi:hypothetical protein